MENKLPRKGKKLGVGRKLSKEQEIEIFGLISTKRPFQLGFKLPYKNAKLILWTRAMLRHLIKQRFEVKLTDSGVVNYLTRWRFSPLNRGKNKKNQCHIAIQGWLDIHQEAVIVRSQNENAQIYWMGEVEVIGLQAIERSRNKRLTMIQVIENQGRVHWLTIRGEFHDERQVMLLRSLVGQTKTKVFLIRKTAYHFNTRLVKDWLNENQHAIEIFPPSEWLAQ